MKKSQSEEREELNVVYSYLKMLTITGGLAITSLTLVGHTMLTRFKDNLSHQVVIKQPTPTADLSLIAAQLTPGVNEGMNNNIENQAIEQPKGTIIPVENTLQEEEVQPFAEPQVTEELNPQLLPEQVAVNEHEPAPSAQIDVFPAGYGTFRILIESDTTDHFTATLSDMLHQEIVTEQYDVVQGKNEFLLDSGEIPRGDYVLKVSNGMITSQKRVTLK